MQRRNSVCSGLLAAALSFAGLAWPEAAGAVNVVFGTSPELYAVTYLYEDWTQEPIGPTAFVDNTEQLTGASSVSSVQTSGIDALPNPSCTPPCAGLTAEATSAYEAGGLTFSALSHAYANFDLIYTTGMPPTRLPGYSDGNLVKAESAAAVLDVLTITSPVQLQLQGSVVGESSFTSASDSQLYANELSGTYFGVGDVHTVVVVELSAGPPIYYYQGLQTVNVNASLGEVVSHDEPLTGSATVLTPGEYVLKAQLRTYARIGTVNGPTLSVQDMRSDFAHTASFRLVADDPSAVTSASGQLTFTGVPEPSRAVLEAVAAIALALRARTARRRGCRRSAPAPGAPGGSAGSAA